MEIEGKLNWVDFLRSKYLEIRPKKRLHFINYTGYVGCTLFYFYIIIILYNNNLKFFSAIFLVLFIGIVFILAVWLPWYSFSLYKNSKRLNMPLKIEIDENFFSFSNELGKSKVPWEDIKSYKENNHLFLFFESKLPYFIIPKHLFSNDEDLGAFQKSRASNPMC